MARSAGKSLAQLTRKARNTQATAKKPKAAVKSQEIKKAGAEAELSNMQKAKAQAGKMQEELRQNKMAQQGKDVKTHDGSAPPHVTGKANSSSNDSYNPSGLTRSPARERSRGKGRSR